MTPLAVLYKRLRQNTAYVESPLIEKSCQEVFGLAFPVEHQKTVSQFRGGFPNAYLDSCGRFIPEAREWSRIWQKMLSRCPTQTQPYNLNKVLSTNDRGGWAGKYVPTGLLMVATLCEGIPGGRRCYLLCQN